MTPTPGSCPTDISDKDVLEAMKSIPGYLDITPADFRIIYLAAYRLAVKRLEQSVRAGDIMTHPVISLGPDASLAEAAEVLAGHRISGAPVVDGAGRVLGVVSEKDFLALMGASRGETFMRVVALCLGGQGCPGTSGRNRTVAEVMSAPAVTIGEGATLAEISALMTQKGINRLPVLDENGRLAGIVTRAALVTAACALEE
jgi:CBS-domain-containing membrane protein